MHDLEKVEEWRTTRSHSCWCIDRKINMLIDNLHDKRYEFGAKLHG
jgi:hypothetical protein